MPYGRAFRAQLVMQGQRELFDYWHISAGVRRMPARSDLDPLKVPKLLPCIGLIDVREGLDKASFRLAGTRLHDIYGQEITGKRAAKCSPETAPNIGAASMIGWWSWVSAPRCRAGPGQGPRSCRVVLAEASAVGGRWPGRSDPVLRRGRPHRERSRDRAPRPLLSQPSAAASAAAAGAIRLTPEPAEAGKLPFVSTQQAEMPIQVIAPMAWTGPAFAPL